MFNKKIYLIETIAMFILGIVFTLIGILIFIINIDSTKNIVGYGVACLSISVFLMLISIYSFVSNNKNQSTYQKNYERQIQVHLVGFLITFFLFVTYVVIIGLLDTCFSISFSSFLVESIYGLIGVSLILILYFIWNDSFINLENQKELLSFVAVYFAIGIANLSLGISNSSNLISQNQLTSNSMYFAVAIFNVIIAVILLIKNYVIINRNEE